jgi:uncharacterized protein YcbX
MNQSLTNIWRHPIKSHGREELKETTVLAGKSLPWDRHWAVGHDAAKLARDAEGWISFQDFSRGAKAPGLMAISASFDEATNQMTLTHPSLAPITFNPDDPADQKQFLVWVTPICPADRALPASVQTAPARGFTDTDYASISMSNHATHRAVSQKFGRELSVLRWRGNLWVDGLAPFEEFDWIDKTIAIGKAEFRVVERIGRCLATTANPETGIRDADTLGTLRTWGHQDFGVYLVALNDAHIQIGDPVRTI